MSDTSEYENLMSLLHSIDMKFERITRVVENPSTWLYRPVTSGDVDFSEYERGYRDGYEVGRRVGGE